MSSHQLTIDVLVTLFKNLICACEDATFSSKLRQLSSFLLVDSTLAAQLVHISFELELQDDSHSFII